MRSRLIWTALLPAALLLGACEVDVEEQGELPSADVDVEGGQMPEYDVVKEQEGEMPDVDVRGQEGNLPEYEVRGPDVEVERETVEVPVPDVDVEAPAEDRG